MPSKALRPCSTPGCPTLVGNGRTCAAHPPRKPWTHAVESSTARGYGYSWQQARAKQLREQPWCEAGNNGTLCGRPATTVDHHVPKMDGGTDDPANLVSMCRSCQQRKAGREGQRASAQSALRRAKRRYGFAADSGEES